MSSEWRLPRSAGEGNFRRSRWKYQATKTNNMIREFEISTVKKISSRFLEAKGKPVSEWCGDGWIFKIFSRFVGKVIVQGIYLILFWWSKKMQKYLRRKLQVFTIAELVLWKSLSVLHSFLYFHGILIKEICKICLRSCEFRWTSLFWYLGFVQVQMIRKLNTKACDSQI